MKDHARRLGNYIAEHRLTEQPWPTATQLLLAWLQLYTLGGYQPPMEELFMAEALIGGLVEQALQSGGPLAISILGGSLPPPMPPLPVFSPPLQPTALQPPPPGFSPPPTGVAPQPTATWGAPPPLPPRGEFPLPSSYEPGNPSQYLERGGGHPGEAQPFTFDGRDSGRTYLVAEDLDVRLKGCSKALEEFSASQPRERMSAVLSPFRWGLSAMEIAGEGLQAYYARGFSQRVHYLVSGPAFPLGDRNEP